MTNQLESKEDVSYRLLADFVIKNDEPVLAFGAGRESCTIVGLLRRLTTIHFEKVRVVIADTDSNGMAQAQAALMRMLGFSKVEVGPGTGVGARKKDFPLGVFPVQPPHWNAKSADTLLVRTNWADALESYEHIIVGMRKDDRPPRDQIVNFLGTETFGCWKSQKGLLVAEKPKHILFPLADWTSQDLDDYLAQGIENRIKVLVANG